MFDDLFDNRPPVPKASPASSNGAAKQIEDFGAFGWLPGEQARAVMLELRHANGLITAYSYSWLESAEFNPSVGVTLNFSEKTVKLIGRNLNDDFCQNVRLFQGVIQHRVPWIQEIDPAAAALLSETATVVERIELVD